MRQRINLQLISKVIYELMFKSFTPTGTRAGFFAKIQVVGCKKYMSCVMALFKAYLVIYFKPSKFPEI